MVVDSVVQHKIRCSGEEYFMQVVPEPADVQSFFAFSLPKAGSTLLNAMLQDVCIECSVPVISPYSSAFSNGILTNSIGSDLDHILFQRGYAYLGFRHFLPYDSSFDFSSIPVILLVRDPRDMLTSLYFSIKYSHALPDKKGSAFSKLKGERHRAASIGIDEFVLSVEEKYVGIYQEYMQKLIGMKNVHVFRYEDIIFDKFNWLFNMLEIVGLDLSSDSIQEIASKHDIRPQEENVGSHIRQVTPGNYKKHLSVSCINKLNTAFTNVLKIFDYSC